jgi:hypothetical protein
VRVLFVIKLNMSRRKTTLEYIEEAEKVHKNKYDYSKTIYTSAHNKIILICPIHGEFIISAYKHLQGQGCKYCGYEFTPSFWAWFFVPHIGSKRYFRCEACGDKHFMRRK